MSKLAIGWGYRAAVLCLASWALAGCSGEPGSQEPDAGVPGVKVVFDPTLAKKAGHSGATWVGFPFPSDHRRDATGHLKLSDFPGLASSTMFQRYVALAEAELTGFSTTAPVHMSFDGALDAATIPTDPGAFLATDSPIQLIDVTASSPEYGKRRPLRWEYRGNDLDISQIKYVYKNSLAVGPTFGFPMRPATTYALVVLRSVKGANGAPLGQHPLLAALLTGGALPDGLKPPVPQDMFDGLKAIWAPLLARLAVDGIGADQIAAATVFTTQDPSAEMREIHRQVSSELPAPALGPWHRPFGVSTGPYAVDRSFRWNSTSTTNYSVMEGQFDSPNYQEGTVPYADDGGNFHVVDGKPAPFRTETLRFVLTIPKDPPRSGSCYPIVEIAHGTGGNAYSGYDDGTAGRLAARGLASIALDQPLHGPRAEGKTFDVGLLTFNYTNPKAGRCNFRQSAIDTFSLTRLLKSGALSVPAANGPGGQAVCFDTTHVGFFGHSQGGITGALAAAFERGIESYLLSGAGGGMSITIMERKDTDIATLLTTLLELTPQEPLSELHPVLTLVQTLVDATDPINASPRWADAGGANFLVTSGLLDVFTPYRTANAMAVAGMIPSVLPMPSPIREMELAGLTPLTAPVKGNLTNSRTGGFLQFAGNGQSDFASHFLVFYRPEAIQASMRFLQSAAYESGAVIERDPNSDSR